MDRAKLELDDIFCAAMELALPAERVAYLDKACGADLDARRRVERLLDAHLQAGSFLGARHAVAQPATDWPDQAIGSTIGPYKLLELVGEGGMGLVYVAEQQEPVKRRVALKIIKPGMDSRQVIARFEAERQALAIMDHPNIAKIHDGGTTSSESGSVGAGRPYFVMELVKGKPITEYADLHRLTTRQRLELFLDVCHAVQHAHLKGIIHRDLKPSNVLVSLQGDRPVVKIIDFGVAKAIGERLTDQSIYTCLTQMIGTPLYMSPEQAGLSDSDVDTRSDVYSLGVLLYELLTGTTPFESATLKHANYDELRRIIREDEPPRPSTRLTTMEQASLSTICECRSVEPRKLNQQVRGDLDWVVMKALEKDRDRRYESASALAADVQRYLDEDAVEACPPSAGYRLRKYVRRNRRLLITVAVIGTVLVAATAVSTWQAVEANAARREATTEAAIARAVNDFLQGDLLGQVNSDPEFRDELTGNVNLTVKELLDRAAAKIDERFEDQPLVEAAIRAAIGDAYNSLHAYQLAATHLDRAVGLRQSHLGPNNAETLASMSRLAHAYSWLGRHPDVIVLREQILRSKNETLGPNHAETLACVNDLAGTYRCAGLWNRSVVILEQLLDKQLTVYGPTHPSTLETMHDLAMNYGDVGRFAESMALHEKALKVSNSTMGTEHPSIHCMLTIARDFQRAGKLERAGELLLEVRDQIRKREDSPGMRHMRANASGWLGLNLVSREQYNAAEPLVREAVAIFEKELPNMSRRFYWLSLLGAVLTGQQKYAEAEPLLLQGYIGMKEREACQVAYEKYLLGQAGERIVQFYETTRQPEKTRMWRQRLLEEKSKK